MRYLLLGAAAFLGACSAEVTSGADGASAGPYVLQVVADQGAEIYYVTGPDDRAAAARVADGVSTLIEPNAARLAVGETRAALADAGPPPNEAVNIRVPGFSMSIAADHDDPNADSDRAVIAINAGGREVNINADGDDGNENAHVRITGATESDARGFINDQDELSVETKQGMLAALGLAS